MPGSQYTPYTPNSTGLKTTTSYPFILGGVKWQTKTDSTLNNGQVTSSQVTLQQEISSGKSGTKSFYDYATSYDGGKTWVTPGSQRSGGNQALTPQNSGLTASQIQALQPGGNLNKAAIDSATTSLQKNGASPTQTAASVKGPGAAPPPAAPAPTAAGSKLTQKDVNTLTPDAFIGKTEVKAGSSGTWIYPFTLDPTKTDVIKFTALKFQGRKISSSGFSIEAGDYSTGSTTVGTVMVPIQPTISDYNSVQWSEIGITAGQTVATELGLDIAQGKGVDDFVKKSMSSVAGENAAIRNAVTSKLIEDAAGTKGLLSRLTGAIGNPNLELLFQGPSLRPFNFTIKMTPRSGDDAKNVKGIIRFFKQNMAVQRTKTELFLKAPNVFNIQYLYKNTDNPAMNLIKGPCALLNCSVDYTPTGSYMTFTDGNLVAYTITLQFMELEPVYYDDYDKVPATSIGY
jgi:hypothetical protein